MDLIIVIIASYLAYIGILLFLIRFALVFLIEYIANLYVSSRDGYVLSL